MKIFMYILIVVAGLFCAIAISDIIEYLSAPDTFGFGTEVAGWKYASAKNFIIANSIVTFTSIFVIILSAVYIYKN